MKTAEISLRFFVSALTFGFTLLVGGCGNSAQKEAYEHAEKAEQQMTAENAPAIVSEFKQVIALKPDSEWAKKAQSRIDAVEAKTKADELHKNVFQEHGVD